MYKFLTKKYYFNPSNKDDYINDLSFKTFKLDNMYKDKIPEDMIDLMSKGYNKDPKNRPNIL